MILALFLVLAFQLVGEALSRIAPFTMPGPVMGMVLLVVALRLSPPLMHVIRPVSQTILGNLSLLFVPAGVGIVGHLGLMRQDGLALLAAIAVSTVLAIALGALTFQWVARAMEGRDDA